MNVKLMKNKNLSNIMVSSFNISLMNTNSGCSGCGKAIEARRIQNRVLTSQRQKNYNNLDFFSRRSSNGCGCGK